MARKEVSQGKFNLEAARSAMGKIRAADLEEATVDEIKELLTPIFSGYSVTAPRFNAGLLLYSGQLGPKPTRFDEISYPQPQVAAAGRANRKGDAVLYCSTMRQVVFFDVAPKVGDTLTLIHWETTAPLFVNHVGYTRRVFESLGSVRKIASWCNDPPQSVAPEFEEVTEFLSEVFTRTFSPAEEKHYKKLTAAIGEKLFASDPFDGLMFPALSMRANSDNIVIKPRFADDNLRFVRAEFIKINEIDDFSLDFKVVDTAREIGPNGIIEWYIAPIDGKKSLSKRYGTVGWQEFLRQKKDILSVYDSAKESNFNRPVHTEHGNVGEASFRNWLSEYLPKKYSVTSGFIIPDERSMNYVIRHHDIILYDAQNSPVLWGSNNLDKSEQGRERAIPAKHVHAVFEVKATLNKKSLEDAIAKLQELNVYRSHLPTHFVCGTVFFEVREKEQESCDLIDRLFREGIVGYFGGLILRAEGFDSNLTGYYQLMCSDSDTVHSMPMIREPGILQRDEDGNPQLTEQGSCITAHSIDDIWNFDKGYSPVVKNVHLLWSYNSFPRFFIELLERLQGRYDPENPSKDAYGLSFLR